MEVMFSVCGMLRLHVWVCTWQCAETFLPDTLPKRTGAQVTPGGSVDSGSAFAWDALGHSDSHRYVSRMHVKQAHSWLLGCQFTANVLSQRGHCTISVALSGQSSLAFLSRIGHHPGFAERREEKSTGYILCLFRHSQCISHAAIF